MGDRAAQGSGGADEPRVSVVHEGDTTVVVIEGELDPDHAPAVGRALAACAGDVVIDAERVDFISSSGLSVLVELANRLEQTGGYVRLRRPSPMLARLLHLSDLDDRFPRE